MLINKEYLKKYSLIPLNYNLDEVMNYVELTEKIWILPILGETLFEQLESEIENEEISKENQTLLLEMYPYFGAAFSYEVLPFVAYHFSEVGVTKGESDNSKSLEIKELNYLSQNIRSKVETLKENFIKWLKERCSTFKTALVCLSDGSCCGNEIKDDCSCKPKLKKPNRNFPLYKAEGRKDILR